VLAVIAGWAAAPRTQDRDSAPPAGKTPHVLHGTITHVDAASRTLTVNNENVPGWMPPMTMNYKVSNPDVLSRLKSGDRIAATVYDGDVARLYRVRLDLPQPVRAAALPPISYVCPSPGEEGVIEDHPGRCPKSGLTLTPVRLTIAYSCLRGPQFIQESPGTCAYDKSPLAPVTTSVFWSCEELPRRYLAPGMCRDGSARTRRFAIRPHGDHNPRHGGLSVFMSEDLLHHLEGTLVATGIFRVYFYNEYTRPVSAAGITARVAIADANAHEIDMPVPLQSSSRPNANFLEARVPNIQQPTQTTPLDFRLRVTIPGQPRDWVTDHHFDRYSKDPSSAARKVTKVDAAAASLPFTAQEEVLPGSIAQLLELLAMRASSLQSLVEAGDFGAVWFPALGAKTVAIALEVSHSRALTPAARMQLSSAVRQLTTTAWQIDSAGDLGNKERLLELQRDFLGAVSKIQTVYADAR
jgi:Cu/Ag efflux protein CusF